METKWLRTLFRRRLLVCLLILLQIAALLVLLYNGAKTYLPVSAVLTIISLLITLFIISNFIIFVHIKISISLICNPITLFSYFHYYYYASSTSDCQAFDPGGWGYPAYGNQSDLIKSHFLCLGS